MYRDLEHPEISWSERTGYPSWMQEGETEEEERDAYEAYCDHLYEERRERELFGE